MGSYYSNRKVTTTRIDVKAQLTVDGAAPGMVVPSVLWVWNHSENHHGFIQDDHG